jgi:predicted cupin superfamily sugar epimerase
MVTVKELVEKLNLHPHPEGGYFAEHFRSPQSAEFEGFSGKRNYSTSIYFLLEEGQFSALHRIKSDEIWHFYLGDPLEIVEIGQDGNWISTILGQDLAKGQKLSYVVKAGNWFGSRPLKGSLFCLVGCTVAPGFDFQDFEMPNRSFFCQQFPSLKNQIEEFTRE